MKFKEGESVIILDTLHNQQGQRGPSATIATARYTLYRSVIPGQAATKSLKRLSKGRYY